MARTPKSLKSALVRPPRRGSRPTTVTVPAFEPTPDPILAGEPESLPDPAVTLPSEPTAAPTTKMEQVIAGLRRPEGMSVPDIVDLTGWQSHSVRGFMSGALKKKRGLTIVSEKIEGQRVYRIAELKA